MPILLVKRLLEENDLNVHFKRPLQENDLNFQFSCEFKWIDTIYMKQPKTVKRVSKINSRRTTE